MNLNVVIIILASLCLIALIVLIVIILKNKSNKSQPIDLKEIGSLSKQIEFVSKETKANIESALAAEMLKLSEVNSKANENNSEKLERFQKNITESISNRFEAMDKQLFIKLDAMNKKVDEKLAEGFKGTSESMAAVRERLQAIDTAQKNIETLGKDVVSLKQVLEGNQTRGQYGEYQLKMVLHNVFGDTIGCYEEQYTMKKTNDGNDVRADAVVFMPEPNHMICIDSKFPFKDYEKLFDDQDTDKENHIKEFARAVKLHITTIKDKYIVDGKTAPQALMFIPNDGVFAFVHHNCQDVVDYAREKNVVLTSPSTLPAILVTINMIRVEVERTKNAKEISKQLQRLGKDFEMFAREWNTFSDQLERADKSRGKLSLRVNKINGKFDAIKSNDKSMIEENNDEIIDEEN